MQVLEHELRLPWRRPLPAIRAAVTGEQLAYVALFAVALAMRLLELSERPLHQDESSHAWFAWLFVTSRGYEYDPVFHGPVQFYLPSLAYVLVGAGDFGVRLAPAVLGATIAVLPYLLRRHLGRAGALAAAVLLCISPSYLYFSRFAREDVYVATLTLALIVAVFRFVDRPRPWHPAVILGLLAASFATKETTYITVFVGGSFFLALAGWQSWRARRQGRPVRSGQLVTTVRSLGLDAWIWGAATFTLVFTVLFTTFLLEPQGLRTALSDSLGYWLSQHDVRRGSQPWFYYLVVLPAYELPVLLLAAVGVVAALRRPTMFRLFLVWDAALSLVVYSWAGERMPWLVLHPLLPLVLLAGVGVQALWQSRRLLLRAVLAVAAAVGAAMLLYGAAQVSYAHPADPAELLVFTQTSPELEPIRDRLLAIDRRARAQGGEPTIYVDSWGGTAWPLAWYLRDVPVSYVDMSAGAEVDGADAVIVDDINRQRMRRELRGYRGVRYHLREWWVVDYAAISPRTLWRWYLERRAWGPKGYLDQWLYVPARGAGAARSGLAAESRAP